MKIAIVGMGVAGISVLREIKNVLNQGKRMDVDIVVFSNRDQYGTGMPYQKDDEALLINQYTDTMTIDPSDSEDFLKWVTKYKGPEHQEKPHLPRKWFGEYLSDRLKEWSRELTMNVIYEDVQSMHALSDGRIKLKSATRQEIVDGVHLAIGHSPYADPYRLKGLPGYIYHPYPFESQLKLENQSGTVGIIGTRLTAMDAMLFLQRHYPETNIAFLSLDKRFSSVRGHHVPLHLSQEEKEQFKQTLIDKKDALTFEDVKEAFSQLATKKGINVKHMCTEFGQGSLDSMRHELNHLDELGRFQQFISQLKETFPYIWWTLPKKEKVLFKNKYEEQFLNFKIPVTEEAVRSLIQSVDQKKIAIYSHIQSIKRRDDRFEVNCENGDQFTVDVLINATGQSTNLYYSLDLHQPLIKQLIEEGFIVPYPYGGVKIDYPSMSAIDRRGRIRSTFKVYGQLASGVQYGNTNVDMVSKSAEVGVRDMMDVLVKRKTKR
ncbi:FAD/NAD(P)-binding protein [Alkalibacterium sp. MB6]|uniref:FAD/NAD(P)-binding protein n=1 Tax=Alkalibacterium sp. MB6 TaxID=2081965 RepID=UPI0013795D00|nr:FAD/NAD(P)-binding protein [Alkalibacterium sp. MB6]